jgi:probable rRNA maturation factor
MSDDPGGSSVAADDQQSDVPVDVGTYGRLATKVLQGEGASGSLSLVFVDEARMAELNAQFLGETGPTDVLAFPLHEDDDPHPDGAPVLLGDVVVCPSVARRYATEHGRALEDELALLVVHGVLHVLGHDHADEEDTAVMQAAEDRHLTGFREPPWTWSRS